MELIHKQEEMEQLELEQALAMSLMAEEERIRRARIEAKNAPDESEDERHASAKGGPDESDAKASRSSDSVSGAFAKASKASSAASFSQESMSSVAFADPKPIRGAPGGMSLSPMKTLPPIGGGSLNKPSLTELSMNYKGRPLDQN